VIFNNQITGSSSEVPVERQRKIHQKNSIFFVVQQRYTGADPAGVRMHPLQKNVHLFLLQTNVFAFNTFPKRFLTVPHPLRKLSGSATEDICAEIYKIILFFS